MYIVKNKFYKITFIGGVNYEFKREGYCVKAYKNRTVAYDASFQFKIFN